MPQSKLKVKLLEYTPNPEKLISTAGKLCYSSVGVDELQENLTEENINKFVNILSSYGHESPVEHVSFTFAIEGISRACYDKETEVYTNNGWKFFKDLDTDDLIMTRNKNGMIEFHKPNDYITYKYNGKLHKYSSQNVDLMVTPNHKMLIKKYDIRTESDYNLIASEDINIKRFYMTKLINWDIKSPSHFIIPSYTYMKKLNNGTSMMKTLPELELQSQSFIKLLAWYLAEGSVYYNEKENSYNIKITQTSIKNNIENRKEIVNLIRELGFTPTIREDSITFKNSQLGLYLKSLGKSYEKVIPKEIFDKIDKNLSRLFVEVYEKSDGYVDKNGSSKLYTTSKELADQLQMLTFRSGYTSKINIDDRVGQSHNFRNQVIAHNYKCYVILISKIKRNMECVIKKDKHITEVDYNDNVYCVDVENHVIFVRRNGICMWCGNCTHQLVRHRIASYSQQSQRYVRLNDFDYIIPKDIENIPEAKNIFIQSMKNSQSDYNVLVDILIKSYICECLGFELNNPSHQDYIIQAVHEFKTNHKEQYKEFEKKAIENARYVFPNACETKIIVTMNARSLLNFFSHRCCNRSQDEIRELADEMLKLCKEVAPTLFKRAGASCIYGNCKEGKMSCGKPRK